MLRKRVFLLLVLSLLIAMTASITAAQDTVTLSILTHWGAERELEAQDRLFEACEAQTGVTVDLQTVPFGYLLTKIIANQTAGTNTDIIHLYN